MPLRRLLVPGVLLAATLTGPVACAAAPEGAGPPKPAFINGPVSIKEYDAASGGDLLTGGLGATRLRDGPAPTPANLNDPTAEELRQIAIFNNYRALVDITTGGGYGSLYGPTVDAPSTAGPDGRIFGVEYLAFAKGRGGDQNITVMAQIPQGFDRSKPCIVTAPSSGSRGVYGAIGTSGEWGLKKGCAVAYTDKGTGIGAHNLQADTVNLLRGERADADAADDASNFTADISDQERLAFNAAFPNRWAFKHAHSELNPEADWDDHVIQSLQFALWALNHRFAGTQGPTATPFTFGNTLVIGSSVSNGGAASLRAAEIASPGVFDGVVVGEPNVNPRYNPNFSIKQGNDPALQRHSRPLYDYLTLITALQGCANLAPANAGALLNTPTPSHEARCASLAQAGLLTSTNLTAQANEAQRIINRYGILTEANVLGPAYWNLFVPQAVSITYANAYARASVLDNLCGYSFAATDPTTNQPISYPQTAEEILFGTANGIPPSVGINVVNNLSPGGPLRDQVSISPAFGRADQNAQGALCLRSLETGRVNGNGLPLSGAAARAYQQVQASIAQIRATGDLDGTPTIIVHGRNDALIAPNHTSRPYYALSRLVDGGRSRIFYYEVTNAHHFEAFNPLAGFNERFIPLHYYFIKSLDLMYAHLTGGGNLPPSQVVHTTPRGTGAPTITAANVPPIKTNPPAADRITFNNRVLFIPD